MPHDETTSGVPDPGRLFETASRLSALARLTEGLGAREPFLLVTGPAGTGKSTLVREAVRRWGARAAPAFVTAHAADGADLLAGILRGFGTEPSVGAPTAQLLDRIERHVAEAEGGGRVPVIVVDDAHALPDESFGELWALTQASLLKHRPLEIGLVGLPSLESRLEQPGFENIGPRVAVRCRLQAFSQTEAVAFVREIAALDAPEGPGFLPRKTVREICKRAGGVPGLIHELAGQSMAIARATRARAVTIDHVARAAVHRAATAKTVVTPTREPAAARGVENAPASPSLGFATTPSAPSSDVSSPASDATPSAPAKEASRGAPDAAASVAASDPPTLEPSPSPPVAAAAPDDFGREAAPAPDVADPVPAPAPEAPSEPIEDSPPPDAPEPATGTEPSSTPSPPPADADPRVREWVGRFIKPDAPRFGELLLAPPPTEYDLRSVDWEWDAEASEAADGAGETPPATRTPRRAPRARGRGGSPRRHGAPVGARTVLALVTVAAAVVGAFVVLPRMREATSTNVADGARRRAVVAPVGGASPTEAPPLRAAPASVPASVTTRAPSAKPSPVASAGAAEAADDALFALDVGSYADPDEARAERDRIVIATGLKGWLMPVPIAGGETYRVVIGVYRSRERATISAAALIERELTFEAQVIPLPPRRLRR